MTEHRTTREAFRRPGQYKGLLSLALCMLLLQAGTMGLLHAQDLEDLLNQQLSQQEETQFTSGTFKGTRVVNGHSCEVTGRGDLMFLVSHRFGKVNSGFYSFFGLDDATTRIGFEYGLFEGLAAGIGRSTYEKTYDGFLKYKLLRQSSGKSNMPVTLTLFASGNIKTLKPADPAIEYSFNNRLAYTCQLLVARKFSPRLSLQLSPTYIHKNLVPRRTDQNDILAIGTGGRYKITSRFSVNMEYYRLLPGQSADDFSNSLSLGFDIETGGHVFQLLLTNSRAVFERSFISETSGNWPDGDIHFGFNITRVFHVGGL